jgi:N-acetylmuramic acid 6-phosphate etherase
MGTETRNPKSLGLSEMNAAEIVRLMNEEDRSVAEAVRACADSIARIAEVYADTVRRGNRVFYLGAGTSGGLAQLDAAEMTPTFGLPADTIIALTADVYNDSLDQCLRAGMNAVLTKPIDIDKLGQTLAKEFVRIENESLG